ncbi:23_t:CDS:2 [Racocetra fulgida]|uniref:23_t:CDS:1 n=1 Tax=Racocetra fulgida TaxID=60492 RepID=A0A9N8ZHI4_9GLOM|nr:23_t:CDS:2 [Racocetra fulgida]
MSKSSELEFAQLKTMELIHQVAENNSKIKKELFASIEDIQTILNKRTKYLKLHDNYLLTGHIATDIEIEQFFEQLHIRQNLTCNSPIERNYYSCRIKDVDLCYWCGADDGILEPSENLKSQFKTIYPLCISCEASGHEWSTRAPIVFQSKNKKVRA